MLCTYPAGRVPTTVTGTSKTKNLLNLKPKPKLHNSFAILSQPNAPTNYNAPNPTQKMDDNRIIINPRPTRALQATKIAWRQHIKQTLRQLCKSDDLFLDKSIPHAEDGCTAIAKGDTSNAKHVAIDSAHEQHGQPTIVLSQCGCNTAYCLGSAFNWMIKKLNRNNHVSLATKVF